MPNPAWTDRIAKVLDAAKAAQCTDEERAYALRLLSKDQVPDEAVKYCDGCRIAHERARAARQCPYLGEF